MAIQNENSTLSLTEIKDLVTFVASKKIQVFELGALKFSFHPGAFVFEAPEDKAQAKSSEDAPFGHYKPE